MNRYKVVRSDEYLEHYGVKGMKWRNRKTSADKTYEIYQNRPIARAKTVSNNGKGVRLRKVNGHSVVVSTVKNVYADRQKAIEREKAAIKKRAEIKEARRKKYERRQVGKKKWTVEKRLGNAQYEY